MIINFNLYIFTSKLNFYLSMNLNYKTVLIPIEFNDKTKLLINEGLFHAKLFQLDVIFLHVQNFQNNTFPFPEKPYINKKALINESLIKLDILAYEATKNTGINIITMVEDGKFFKTILKYAELFYSRFILLDILSIKDKNELYSINPNTKNKQVEILIFNRIYKHINSHQVVLPLELSTISKYKIKNDVELVSAKCNSKIKNTNEDHYHLAKLRSNIIHWYTFN